MYNYIYVYIFKAPTTVGTNFMWPGTSATTKYNVSYCWGKNICAIE